MIINLDNYESFFLLYIDNELSAADRKMVETFLGEFPYLQEEMKLLKETILLPEPAHFDFKAGLLKPLISEEMLQENILLHLDNELDGEAKEKLQNLLLTEDNLQQEWALLKRTKLDPTESIVFPGKKSLFREEKGRLVVGRFARWAAAAAIIAGGWFAGILLNRSTTAVPEVASNNGKKAGAQKPGDINAGLVKENNRQVKPGATSPLTGKRESDPVTQHQQLAEQSPAMDKNKGTRNLKTLAIAQANVKKQPNQKPVRENEIDPAAMEPVGRQQDIAKITKPLLETPTGTPSLATRQKTGMHTDINIQPVENLFARNAAMDTDEENSDNHIFMMDEEKVSRTKAAGFFKKIKRTVERTTRIKPGSSLKIAGFEFAVK
jgi:hypothetical protein